MCNVLNKALDHFVLLNQIYSQGNQHIPDITFETYLKEGEENEEIEWDDDIPF